MVLRDSKWFAIVVILTLALTGDTASGRGGRGGGGGSRGGGGGYRGGSGGYRGGGYSRPSYSGHGSIRYSSPRPSTPSYSRPASPSYSRPSAAQRPYGGTAARPATPSYRPSTPAAGPRPPAASPIRPSTYPVTRPSYRPANSGSIVHGGTITGPGGSTIGAVQGPRGGGAVGIKGPEGGTAGAIKGPGGGGAVGIKGPEGGAAGAIRGPRGGGVAGVVGPGGGAAGAIRGPGGAGAAGIRGPGGGAVGAVWGPGGRGLVGVRGPYGNRVVTALPGDAIHYPWDGDDYWHVGYDWWHPCWSGDSVHYCGAYPPIGHYYLTLPDQYTTVVINDNTYYESDGVYYEEGQQDGQQGYVVAKAPEGAEEAAGGEGDNPFEFLKTMCDYLAGLERFSAVAHTTNDQLGESGEKVQVSARRTLHVSRPDKVAVEVAGDSGERRVVYDGKTVSMVDLAKKSYTVVPVPGSIDAALDTLARDYGIVVPLEDLLFKDLYERMEARVSAGQYLGLHTVGGLQCHHLAFLTDTSTWEVWIEAGNKPVPRKITIDYGQGAHRSRYSAEISGWNASPAFRADTFEFELPAGVKQVEIPRISKEGST